MAISCGGGSVAIAFTDALTIQVMEYSLALVHVRLCPRMQGL